MASAPIRFRCFECNQLLGVTRSKAGTVVSCPKCATELIVPEPEDEVIPPRAPEIATSTIEPPRPTAPKPPAEPGLDSGISSELPDIRPEDIRVRSGVVPVSPPPYTYRPPGSEPEPALQATPEPAFEPISPRTVVESIVVPPISFARPEPSVVEATVVPPIQTEERLRPDPIRRALAPPPRSRDLVIPRSVVTAWSLFVLLALAMAFLAGLLAGHFVWRVH